MLVQNQNKDLYWLNKHSIYFFLSLKLFGDVCYLCNRVIEGDGEYPCDEALN